MSKGAGYFEYLATFGNSTLDNIPASSTDGSQKTRRGSLPEQKKISTKRCPWTPFLDTLFGTFLCANFRTMEECNQPVQLTEEQRRELQQRYAASEVRCLFFFIFFFFGSVSQRVVWPFSPRWRCDGQDEVAAGEREHVAKR